MTMHVLCCPGRVPAVDIAAPWFKAVWDLDRQGNLVGYAKCLSAALAETQSGPVTILEDDVEVPAGFGNYVEHFSPWIERQGMPVQWWCNGRMWEPPAWITDPAYFVHRKASKFLSTQAVTYPRALANAILMRLNALIPNAQMDDHGQKHSADYLIGRALHEWKRDFFIHWPPVVDHVGVDSMVAPGIPFNDGFRNNPYYSHDNAIRLMTLRPTPTVLYPGDYDE